MKHSFSFCRQSLAATLFAGATLSAINAPVATVALTTLATLATTTTALADSPRIDDDTTVISVLGTRGAAGEPDIPAAIQVIDRAAIARSGAQTLVQVLATLAGLQVNDSIGDRGRGASLSLRGFGENGVNNVLVLVDGRKLNNPSLAGPDLASLSLQDIDRIEVLYGSAGALYGDQASAGVVLIHTAAATEKTLRVSAARASDDGERYRVQAGHRFDNGLHGRVASEKWLSDNYRDNNEQNRRHDALAIGYDSDDWQLQLDGQHTDDLLRLPGSLNRAQRDTDREQSSSPADFGARDTEAWHLGARVQIGGSWQLLLDGNYRDETGEGALYASPYRYRTELSAWQPRLSGRIGAFDVLLGIDAENADAETDYGFGVTAIDQRNRDLYGQLQWPASETVTLTAGARHSRFEADHNLATDVRQSLDAWQLGTSWAMTETQRVFLRRDDSFRWPSADENGFIEPTRTQLEPQQSTSWELGWQWQTPALHSTITLYRLQLQDEIFYDPSANGPFGPGTGANINLDRSERDGLTVRGGWQLHDRWWGHFNLSAVDARYDSGSFDGNTVPFVAKRQAGAGVSWQLVDAVQLYADAQYTGPRHFAGDNANSAPLLGGYTLFNFAARWQWPHYSLALRVENLADKRYDGFAGVSAWGPAYYYPAPGRQFEVTVAAEF